MPLEVIMPALGMTQDSGQIVSWRKSSGDRVEEGDVLFEVETDKATMEVEAQGSGYLSEVGAAAGEDIPVGQIIALITETPESPAGAANAHADTTGKSSGKETPVSAPPQPQASIQGNKPGAPNASANGRILASPKAKRLAHEHGLDLRQLSQAGLVQPFHAADVLEFLARMRGTTSNRSMEATVPGAEFEETTDRLSTACGRNAKGEFAAVLAAGAARAAGFGPDIVIGLERLDGASRIMVNPDFPGQPDEIPQTGVSPNLVLRDLTGTRLTSVHRDNPAVPTLTLATANGLAITRLDYEPSATGDSQALALLGEFAARLETPLRQLL